MPPSAMRPPPIWPARCSRIWRKVELTHVPYRGSGPALTDLLAGRVDMLFATAATVAGATSGGRLRAIAVTSAERSAAFPGVPTVAEAGVPGYASEGWYGLYAPAGTPRETIDRLNAAANQAIRTETFQRQVVEEGMTIVGGPPAQLADYVRYRGDPLAGGGAARQHHRRVAGTSARPLVSAAEFGAGKARWRRPALCAFSRATAISSSIRRGIRPIGVMGQDMMSDSRTLAVLASEWSGVARDCGSFRLGEITKRESVFGLAWPTCWAGCANAKSLSG